MVGLVSDVGLKRLLNEDSACYLERQNFKIYVVADGMGGHNAGEVASKMAADYIVRYVDENYLLEEDKGDLISKAIKAANEEIFRFSKTNDKLSGMGTTVTASLVTSQYIYVANVGDSCCMAFKNSELKKITKDHSLVQELLDSGTISEFEAINHPKKNIITRALGTSSNVNVDVFKIAANEYDLFILCSDGLTNEVTRDEILEIINNESNYISIANDLVNLAKAKGGRDNITVLLFGGRDVDMNGIVLGNRYELLEKIGEGGMSEVFKARCNKLNRFVAVKILKKEFCNNPEIVEKFKGEATAIATLSDNNIVNILDVGTQDDINYIVMEYVKGKTLKDVIKQAGKLNYETGISVAIQIAKALDCAHRNKIIHRDVKPQNILVTEDGVMKVTDFGIAKSSTSSTITNTSTIMGSAHYLSPEQAKGSFIDCRTDLYSLGVVLYEMVTGTVPFQADSAVTIALKHIQEEVVPPKKLNSKIPDSLNKLILKAMEKEPSKRYQSAKEMIADLQKIKDNPNACIDDNYDDNEHTIIMPAVTEEMAKQSETKKASPENDYYDDDDYYYDDDDDYDEDDKPKKKISQKGLKKIGIGVAGVLAAVLLIFGIYSVVGLVGNNKEVEVPNLVGMSVDEARSTLENLNLVLVEAGEEASDEYEEGIIMQMNPDAGSKAKENDQIRVIVSIGADKLKMPDLLEYDLDKAEEILNSYGLKITNKSEAYSDSVGKGDIISQTPAKDTEITKDQEISVVISKGPKVRYTTVPSVYGLSESEAKSKLANSGLSVSTTTENVSDPAKNGTVISQSYAGESVKQGSTITIVIGKYVAQEPPADTNNNTNNQNNNNNNSSNNNNNGANNNGNNGNNNSNSKPSDTNTTKPSENNPGNNENKEPEGPWDEANGGQNTEENKTQQ